MGNPLNNNVPEGRRVPWHKSILLTQGPICEILAKIAQLLVVVEKLSFFESAILNFFSFILIQISHNIWDTKDFSKF